MTRWLFAQEIEALRNEVAELRDHVSDDSKNVWGEVPKGPPYDPREEAEELRDTTNGDNTWRV